MFARGLKRIALGQLGGMCSDDLVPAGLGLLCQIAGGILGSGEIVVGQGRGEGFIGPEKVAGLCGNQGLNEQRNARQRHCRE